MYSNKVYI